MTLSDEQLEMLVQLDTKERILAELIVWLKAKGLYAQAAKDIQGLPKETTNGIKESNDSAPQTQEDK